MASETQPSVTVLTLPRATASGGIYLWGGMIITILGIAAYLLMMSVGKIHHNPWYTPILATFGLFLVFLSLRQRFNVWRIIVLLLVGGVAGFEWWFLLSESKLPAYAGPVTIGQRFPEFTTSLANGSPFTASNLLGNKETVLIFFRGHW